MPIRDLIIPEASSAIIEPVSQQMVYAVLSRLGLRNTFGDNIYITNDYQKPSLTSDDDHNTLISKNRCDVKMSVSWNPSETKWDVNSFNYTQSYGTTMLLDRSLVPIFNDGVSGVQITEHQLPCSMILEFSLQFKDRELAFLAFSAIANTSLKDSVINVHNLSYSYPVGMDMFKAINQIYQLRKSSLVLPFWDYLQRCSCGAIQYIQQRTGDLVELVIKRHDLRTMGVLEYNQTAPTVIDQDRGVDRFVVEFTYTIQFARPDALRLSFPVVICNQMVPLWMIPKPVVSETSKLHGILQEHSLSWYLKSISTHQQVVTRLPSYDDFRPPYEPVVSAGFVEFFDAVVMLDDTDTTTINLLDLGDVQLHEKVVEIMKLEGSDIFSTKSLINLTVYCNDIPVDNTLLSIDNNLVLTLGNITVTAGNITAAAGNITVSAGNFVDSGGNNISATPIGGGMDYFGTVEPAKWLFRNGQAVSRATYAALFAVIGTTFGVGNGTTTFNVPDERGRVSAGDDTMGAKAAGRLTNSATGGCVGTIGDSGGEQAHTMTTLELVAHTHNLSGGTLIAGSQIPQTGGGLTGGSAVTSSTGSTTPFNVVQPTLVCYKIIYAGV